MTLTLILASLFWTAAGAESDTVAQGRHIATISGCNDCHSAGYVMSEGQVPPPYATFPAPPR